MRVRSAGLGLLALVGVACGPVGAEVEAAIENTDTVEIVADLSVEHRGEDGAVETTSLMDGVVIAPGTREGSTFEAPRGAKLVFRSTVVREGTTWDMPPIETPARGGLFLLRWAPLVGGGYGYDTADWVDPPASR